MADQQLDISCNPEWILVNTIGGMLHDDIGKWLMWREDCYNMCDMSTEGRQRELWSEHGDVKCEKNIYANGIDRPRWKWEASSV